MDIKIINCKQETLNIKDDITNIVIFPVGHSDAVVGGPDGPLPISIDIDEEVFNNVKANSIVIHKDLRKLYSDFNHNGSTITSYLQDLVWDSAKGIVAQVKLTKEGLVAAKNNILNFFSPTFKIDKETNEILSLCSCFGAFTDSPSLTALREYPITAMDKSNIYYKNLKRKNNMSEQIPITTPIVTPETNSIDVVAGSLTQKVDDKSTITNELKAEIVPTQMETPKEIKAENPDEVDDIKLFDSKFVELFTKYLPDIKKLLGGDEVNEASCQANNALKSLEDKITIINDEQCKIQDALKSVNKEEKEKILRASAPINNVDMPGTKADEVIVKAEQISGKRLTAADLMKHAKKIQKDQDVSFDCAWQQAKQFE